MRLDRWSAGLGLVLAIVLAAGAASAQTMPPSEATGVVARVDARQGVVILDDGRMLRATPATVILAGGMPTTVSALQPGTLVVVRGAEPVAFRGGQYVVTSDAPAASVPAGAVRSRVYGRVKDIDRDGDVKIETPSGSFHIKVSPDAVRTLKDGDTATVEVLIAPPAPTVR
jgi:hypothetical protein